MGLLKDIIKTASPALGYAIDTVDKHVNNAAEAKEQETRKEELLDSINRDLNRDNSLVSR